MQLIFRSGGFIHGNEQHLIVVLEDDEEEDCTNFVTRGGTRNNWIVVDIPVILHRSKLVPNPIEYNDPSPSPNFEFPVFEADEESDVEVSDELSCLLEQDEKIIQPFKEQIELVNLGSEDDVKEVKIGSRLCPDAKKGLIDLLREYSDVVAWSYQDMLGLDSDIVEHRLPLKPECPSVKQNLRRTHPDMAVKIKEKVQKQIDAGFLVTTEYPPKDDFPLPHIDMLVDNTAKFKDFSFMDGFSRYNQIKMAPEDMEKTTFITSWGTFCYRVMPFGLKNAGATYQRAMTTLFHDMMHKEIEVEKGIKVDPAKVKAIQEMPAPKTEKQVRGFLGRLNYISRFISHMTATCASIFKLLRKDQSCDWTEDCQKAFDSIKEYLLEPPILSPPVEGRPLIMYLTVLEDSMGCVLGQQDETGKKEFAIYYLNKKFIDYEIRYSMLEKTCCALAWAAKRLHQYMLNHTTWLISKMDPIKYIFEKPALTGRISRWQMLLSEYDIKYRSQKAIKDCDEPLLEEGPEPGSRWGMVFDGAVNQYENGIGAVIITPLGTHLPFTARFFKCTNNMAEYEVCIIGLEEAMNLKIKY
ncbi:hypothetical protein KIW84_013814 [Lathyrus oleraceus]|uniref:Retrovirus-related Pol polyprotein from transposon 17.6 n=1 Tax=Pisum sativum TaxID=3888 RepID=A0A9D5GYB4_PEA|nr:hypothetical protein KIW84_013814 [Pisum sativum]